MPQEIEAKVQVSEGEAQLILSKLGDEGRKMLAEKNCLYDTPKRKLMDRDQVLRVRQEVDLMGNTSRVILTYKGPVVKGEFKTREEREVVSSTPFEAVEAFLTALGYQRTFGFEKLRYEWHWLGGDGLGQPFHKAVVCVDQLPLIGHFVEVEAECEEHIREILKELGFDGRKNIKDGYPKLLRKAAEKSNEPLTTDWLPLSL